MEGIDNTNRLGQIARRRNFIAYLLLLFAFSWVAYGLSEIRISIALTTLLIPALIGLTYSWLCSFTSMKDWQFVLVSFFLGTIGSIVYFAQLINPITALIKAIAVASIRAINGSHGTSDNSSIYFASQQFTGQLETFYSRVTLWVEQLLSGQVRHDQLIMSMLWGLVIWLVAVWASWIIFRYRSAIIAVLPVVIMFAAAMNYVSGNPLLFIPLIGITLFLIAISNYHKLEQYWEKHHIDFAEDIRLDISQAVILLSIGIMGISAIAPTVSIRKIVEATQKISQSYQNSVDTLAKSLGLQPGAPSTGPFDELQAPELPRSHLLGSGPELSKDVVMVIETGDLPAAGSLSALPAQPYQYYWRSTTYDIYTGQGWATSSIQVRRFNANQPIISESIPVSGTLRLVHQTVQLTKNLGGLIYSAGQINKVNNDYQVAWRTTSPDQKEQNLFIDEFAALYDGPVYRVESYINTPDIEHLQSASGTTPAWIRQRYLALPDGIPDRVRQLAFDLTKDRTTDYARATALESFLRAFPYSLDVPLPPSNRDVVDYFLFDLKRGYCDYYASAMVVMARMVGLPARLVSGYASGIYDPINARYVVTEADAHSWAEIYLAGIGWVEFEPTGGSPAIQRLALQTDNIELPQFTPIGQPKLFGWLKFMPRIWLFIITGSLIIGISLRIAIGQWKLHRRTPGSAIIFLYMRLYHAALPLVAQSQAGDTPFEFVDRLNIRLGSADLPHRWKHYFGRGIGEARSLTNLYTLAVYSPHAPIQDDQTKAINIWVHLRTRLWIMHKYDQFKRSLSKLKLTRSQVKKYV